jgi:hypothetical protein
MRPSARADAIDTSDGCISDTIYPVAAFLRCPPQLPDPTDLPGNIIPRKMMA